MGISLIVAGRVLARPEISDDVSVAQEAKQALDRPRVRRRVNRGRIR
jgi:hypothetical protein